MQIGSVFGDLIKKEILKIVRNSTDVIEFVISQKKKSALRINHVNFINFSNLSIHFQIETIVNPFKSGMRTIKNMPDTLVGGKS